MITIVEPRHEIIKLWGKQVPDLCVRYRLMKYVLQVIIDNRILLHNVITGQLVILSDEERELVNNLPIDFSAIIGELVEKFFLVPEEYNEHKTVVNLRKILRKLDSARTKPVKWYTILPTTACNARCYYCFEQGIRNSTMSEQTADNVVNYIDSQCGDERSVYITWFGGEPTVASNRIDQICAGLIAKGIKFKSSIATNGYLFDEVLTQKAKELWNLDYAQICVDGSEKNYNSIKAFVNATGSPYQKVLGNIGLLLSKKIHVSLRMNFDVNNYCEFTDIINEAINRYGKNPYLHVNAYPVVGEYQNKDGIIQHGTDEWLINQFSILNEMARKAGVATEVYRLPSLEYIGCDADNKMAVTITPEGALVRCCECLEEEEFTGNVVDGITDSDLYLSWQKVADYKKCQECVMYPKCMRIKNCRAQDRCYYSREKTRQCTEAIKAHYKEYKNKVN